MLQTVTVLRRSLESIAWESIACKQYRENEKAQIILNSNKIQTYY